LHRAPSIDRFSDARGGVRKSNTGECSVANSRTNLAIKQNVARIQAAGSKEFVKSLQNDKRRTACEAAETP